MRLFSLIIGLVFILILGGFAAWLWTENNALKEKAEQERKRIKIREMQLTKEQQDLQVERKEMLAQLDKQKQDFQVKQKEALIQVKAKIDNMMSEGKSKADALKQEIARLKEVDLAYQNLISDYHAQRLVPNIGLFDELASESSSQIMAQKLAQKLRDARKQFRHLLKSDKAASGGTLQQRQMLLEMFNDKVDVIQASLKHDNFNVLNQKLSDAYVLVNHYALISGWKVKITSDYYQVRKDELRWAATIHEVRQKEKEEQ